MKTLKCKTQGFLLDHSHTSASSTLSSTKARKKLHEDARVVLQTEVFKNLQEKESKKQTDSKLSLLPLLSPSTRPSKHNTAHSGVLQGEPYSLYTAPGEGDGISDVRSFEGIQGGSSVWRQRGFERRTATGLQQLSRELLGSHSVQFCESGRSKLDLKKKGEGGKRNLGDKVQPRGATGCRGSSSRALYNSVIEVQRRPLRAPPDFRKRVAL